MAKHILCRLCAGDTAFCFKKKLLKKHNVSYLLCEQCGSLQTEYPYWLEEAYTPENERFDTGAAYRSLQNAAFLFSLYHALAFDRPLSVLDYGCGTGLLVRQLRDAGVEAFGYDAFTVPRYAVGFRKDEITKNTLVNLCEVAEHFVEPATEFRKIFTNRPPAVVIQTEIMQQPDYNWNYLSSEMGQHVFFYSKRAIKLVADLYNYSVYQLANYFLFLDLEFTSLNRQHLLAKLASIAAKPDDTMTTFLSHLLKCGYHFPTKDLNLIISLDKRSQ
jgi:hypothetical protein